MLFPNYSKQIFYLFKMNKPQLSYPNFVRGLSLNDILILASRIMILGANYSAKQGITQCFDQENKKIPRKGAKGSFLDFSRP